MSKIKFHKTASKDITDIVLMEGDKDNTEFIFPNSNAEHLNLICDTNIEHLTLKLGNKKIIGFAILAGIENNNKSIEFRRIVINEKGKGFGRMAIKELKKYCFEKLNCHRLWLDVLETNERAKYLYRSEGFKEEGKLRDCILVNGEYNSLIIMSILKDEYKNISDNNISNQQ